MQCLALMTWAWTNDTPSWEHCLSKTPLHQKRQMCLPLHAKFTVRLHLSRCVCSWSSGTTAMATANPFHCKVRMSVCKNEWVVCRVCNQIGRVQHAFMLLLGICVWSMGGHSWSVQTAQMLHETRGVRGCVHCMCVVHKISILRHRGKLWGALASCSWLSLCERTQFMKDLKNSVFMQ